MQKCPTCDNAGLKVRRVTLESLLRPELRNYIGDEQYCVCVTPDCETVYFGPSDGKVFLRRDLTVRFGLKETESPRHICYCFDHTVEEIEDEIRRTGKSTVIESIEAGMKGSGCRCESTNPLGGCCLKSIQTAVADAFRSIGSEGQAATAWVADVGDCCATPSETIGMAATASDRCQPQSDASGGGSERDRAGTLAAGGSVVAAILSSACCWLPLLLIAFGASAAGVAGFFEAYRPYLIGSAVGLLGFGFYMVYFRKERCEPGSACATPNRKLRAFNRVMLWTATTLVGAFVLFPSYVGFVLGSSSETTAALDATAMDTSEYHIEGMTCEGCANILQMALAKLPDVQQAEVDYGTRTAVVRYRQGGTVSSAKVIEAVKAAGYIATMVD